MFFIPPEIFRYQFRRIGHEDRNRIFKGYLANCRTRPQWLEKKPTRFLDETFRSPCRILIKGKLTCVFRYLRRLVSYRCQRSKDDWRSRLRYSYYNEENAKSTKHWYWRGERYGWREQDVHFFALILSWYPIVSFHLHWDLGRTCESVLIRLRLLFIFLDDSDMSIARHRRRLRCWQAATYLALWFCILSSVLR